MIYENKERAHEVAAQMNEEKGYPKAYVCLTEQGWTVIRSYTDKLIGKYGVILIAN